MPAESGNTLLIQFAKAPERGRVKSRMLPDLSPDQALDLHCELVLWTTRQLVTSGLGTVQLAVAGDTDHPLFDNCVALGAAQVVAQVGEDLGERMYQALQLGLQSFEKVLLVGSDCPRLDRDYLAQALDALENVEVVLGPASDGGYVLIGATVIGSTVFEGIDWGTSSVFSQTTRRLDAAQISWSDLPARQDIDRPDDLPHWEAVKKEMDWPLPRFAVGD